MSGMIYQMSVPAAVPGVAEIRILEWHGEPGTEFKPGDLIVELETHKAVVEARAGQPGVLREIKAGPGDWREIGLVLALFSDGAEEPLPSGEDITSELLIEFDVI
jgi:pyruvate/2-oxoglutarate dehydrogenase complex dihydrolipoamide acyltransferase (E2) component